jgi:hypothetical protein
MTEPEDDMVAEGSPVSKEDYVPFKRRTERQAPETPSTEEGRTTTLRTRQKSFKFVTEFGEVTGTPQEFSSDTAIAILKIASQNGVRLIVN